MLRRLPSAASFSSLLSPRSAISPPPDTPPRGQSIPRSDSGNSISSPSLTEALSYDIVNSLRPDRTAQAKEDLLAGLEQLQTAAPTDLDARLGALATIQLVLQHEERDLAEAFARNGGFEVVIGALASLDAVVRSVDSDEEQPDDLRYHLATLIFHVLHLALLPHLADDTFSFAAISPALELSGLITANSTLDEKARTLSLLWAFLVGDFSSPVAILVARARLAEQLEEDQPSSRLEAVRKIVRGRPAEQAVHAAILPILVDAVEAHLDPFDEQDAQLRLLVLCFLERLVDPSDGARSLVALAEAGLLDMALRRWLPEEVGEGKGPERGAEEGQVWKGIVVTVLGRIGASGPNLRRLLDAAVRGDRLDEETLRVLLNATRTSRDPPYVEFDLARTGSGCLNLRSLGKTFPPPTHGYTFLAWISISAQPTPTSSPLIIFGATDPSSKTFFELSLTPDLYFSLQTSLRAPPIVFSATNLSLNRFHHVALVHQRPKFVSQGTVSLYVDGVLAETVKAAYPAAPPPGRDVSAWLGTPSERAAHAASVPTTKREGPRWRLGPSWLVHGELPEEMVFVCHALGPRYSGNLQDTLGRFLTNTSASSVNLRLDALSRDSSSSGFGAGQGRSSSAVASSPLIFAVRQKGSAIVPEHRLYFTLSPANLLSSRNLSPALKLSSTPQALETVKLALAKGDAVLNSALPVKLEEAVVKLNGLAYVEDGTVAVPIGVDDAIWAAGGLTLVLGWVEKAESASELQVAVELFVEAVWDSWRNSEEAEEQHAYEVFGLLLRRKASLINVEVHDALLTLAGFKLAAPEFSVVGNTLAMANLILDFQLWCKVDPVLQWAHFDRLRELVTTSKTSDYNLRKLNKLYIFRKLVFAVRSHYFDEAISNEVVDLALLILRQSFSGESIRYLASYLAASLPTVSGVSDSSSATTFILDAATVPGQQSPSLRLLQGLHDVLLGSEGTEALAKFAKHIQSKWILLLLQDRRTPPLASVLVMRILVRLLQTQGPAFIAKFANRDSGFSILRAALPHLWNLGQLHLALFALIHEHDISTIPLDAPFQANVFLTTAAQASPLAPDVIRAVIAAVGRGLRAVEMAREAPRKADEVAAHEEESTSECSVFRGFETLVDLLAQAGKATVPDADSPLLGSTPSLADLLHVLKPVLHLPAPPEHTPTADVPLLPILSSAKGYELSTSPDSGTSDEPAANRTGLRLQIPQTTPSDPSASSPLSPFDTIGTEARPESSHDTITESARLVLDLLAQQITSVVTSRQAPTAAAPSTSLPQFASSDPALHSLRLVLDAGASFDARSQVTFRSLLLKEILRRLSRASTTPVVSERVVSLLEVATDFAFQGWITDLASLVAFVLSYAEKLLDETALAAAPAQAGPITRIFRCLNRLVIFSLSTDAPGPILELLAQHQLSAFSPQNDDGETMQLLVYLLDRLVEKSVSLDEAIQVLQLLALNRPADVEGAYQQEKRHDSAAPFVNRLIDVADGNVQAVLAEHRPLLVHLRAALDASEEQESRRAGSTIEAEVSRMRELASGMKQKRDSHRRRLRRRRGSVSDWGLEIQEQDARRIRHTRQDNAEHVERVEALFLDHLSRLQPQAEVGFPGTQIVLDFTEGPHRQRRKLRVELLDSEPVETPSAQEKAEAVDAGAEPGKPLATPAQSPPASPTTKGSETPVIDTEKNDPANEAVDPPAQPEPVDAIEEDKQRKVKRLLEQGDRIEAVYNVSRIYGVEASPALLLVARHNIYLVDGYHQTAEGEVVHSWEAPDEERDPHLQILADLAGRNTRSANLNRHHSRSWSWQNLDEVHERRFLFRDSALELFFGDGQSFLLTFVKNERTLALEEMAAKSPAAVASGSMNFSASSFGAKLSDALVGQRTKLERMTKRWEQRLISNFEYLTFLNTTAGRTYNDLSAYLVFPWILADYTSDELDLENPKTFRDLTKPMGCQTPERMNEFVDRYQQLAELEDGPPPFHYGTHYSSAMIAVGYLVRLAPFTSSYLDLQGGSFDHADRLFWSIEKAWLSASGEGRDVRELTPEFFCVPDFLANLNKLDLGRRQESDEPIDNVVLPAWAKGDPRLFIQIHREALESEHVSQHLAAWIDLIFGYKQRGDAAVEATNVFSHLSYEGAVDLDKMEDDDERKAATSTLHNFGQTPRQLFTRPHPTRRPRLVPKATRPIFAPDLPIELVTPTLIQTILPVATLDPPLPISSITQPLSTSTPDKIRVEVPLKLSIPGEFGHTLQFGYGDGSVRVLEKGAGTVPLALCEGMTSQAVSRVCFVDGSTLIIGSSDATVSVWKLDLHAQTSKQNVFTRLATFRGAHSAPISSVSASKAYSIVVSGDVEGKAMLWDLNRKKPVRAFEGHGGQIQLVSISDTTGDIVTCSGSNIRVWDVNGRLLASQSTGSESQPVTAVAWSRSETSPIIATGHAAGRICLWRREHASSAPTCWTLTLLTTLHVEDRLAASFAASPARKRRSPLPGTFSTYAETITSLAFTTRTLYAGTGGGKVHLFNPPNTEWYTPDSHPKAGSCMGCSAKFSLLETRRRCIACAGIFCSLCSTASPELGGRACSVCFSRLSPLLVL